MVRRPAPVRRSAFRALSAALLLCLVLAAAPRGAAAGSSSVNLSQIADDYYWSLQTRLLRPNFSPRANRAWVAKVASLESRLARIKTANLDPQGKITFRMLQTDLAEQREYVTGGWIRRDINGTESPMQTLAQLDVTMMRNVNDWKWTIKTLKNSTRFMTSYIKILEDGLADGRPQPREAIESAIKSLDILTSSNPRSNPFLAMDQAIATSLAGKPQAAKLRAELAKVVRDEVLPSHRALRNFLKKTYLPRAGKLGADRATYLYHMEHHLGPGHESPEALNRWGRREVKRLQRELAKTARQINPNMKSLPSFMAGLARRKDNGYTNALDIITASDVEIERAREIVRDQIPVPRSTVVVQPVAPYQEATLAAQYYSNDYDQGIMEVNTGPLLASQRRNELATLVTHEVYGGHHLAAMYAQKTEDKLSTYRSGAARTTYDEGWGLYVEQLRDEQGGFTPEERVGYLVNHLWRAARLVVDTGLHTGTMTPGQAREYFRKGAFVSRDAAATEIERYMNWPGQALAYYVGKKQILAIRADVKRILGKRFDARGFHARFLGLGSVPLDEARAEMISWAHRREGQLTKQKIVRQMRAQKRARPRPGIRPSRVAQLGGRSNGRMTSSRVIRKAGPRLRKTRAR